MDPSKFSAQWNLLEFLMTSPELPISYMENGRPVYQKNPSKYEIARGELYEKLWPEEVHFSEMIHKIFAKFDFSKDFVIKWVNYYIVTLAETDRAYMRELYYSPDVDHTDYRPVFEYM